ncbi:MAG: hypothetical protein AB7N71_02525 [Phycisphaerae bacterium]
MTRRTISIALCILPGLILFPVWLNFGLGASEDDILYYLPSRAYLQACFNAGEWPLFNHWNGLGRPFLADPQNATFYPFTWLFYVLPLKFAYPAHLWAHFAIAAIGTYRLARSMHLHRVAAIFAAITFAFGGFMISHRVHFAMQASAAWLPWIIWQQDRLLRMLNRRIASGKNAVDKTASSGNIASKPLNYVKLFQATTFLVILIALQCFAGHFQMVLLTFFACTMLFVFHRCTAHQPAKGPDDAKHSPISRPANAFPAVIMIAAWLFAAALFTVQWLPTAKYARICERADWSYWEFTQNSYELPSLLTFLNPFIFGNRVPNATAGPYWGPSHQCEQLSFIGIVALLLALPALRSDFRAKPQRRRWFALLVASALLALGRYGPLCPLLWLLPGSEAFRGPARALLLIHLALAILAATVIDDLARPLSPTRARMRAALLGIRKRWPLVAGIFIFAPYALAWATVPWLSASSRAAALQSLLALNWSHFLIPAAVALALIVLGFVARRWQAPRLLWLLPLAAIFELTLPGWNIDVPRVRMDFARATRPDPDNQWLGFATQDDRRLWTVTRKQGNTPGEYLQSLAKCVARTNMLEPKEILTDYGPLQPKNFVAALQMEPWGEASNPDALLADTAWMRAARVGWILVCDEELPAPPNCALVTATPGGFRLYVNDDCAPPVGFADASAAAAQISWHSNSEAEIQFYREKPRDGDNTRPTLAVSLIDIPGWSASFEGAPLPVHTFNEVFIGVAAPAAESGTIELHYRAPGFRTGAIISVIAFVCSLVMLTSTWWVRLLPRRASAA